ncbi:unnamed protein product, partial [Echinostoma caproni]|uniref:Acetyltransferase n=1 Tax=Echinostoma caproni TaxID=27848 RepID=A0A183BG55_9TREM
MRSILFRGMDSEDMDYLQKVHRHLTRVSSPTGCPWCTTGQCGVFLKEYLCCPSDLANIRAFPWVEHPISLIAEPSEALSYISAQGHLVHFEKHHLPLIPQVHRNNRPRESDTHHIGNNLLNRSIHTRRVLGSPESHFGVSDSEEDNRHSQPHSHTGLVNHDACDMQYQSCLHRVRLQWRCKVDQQLDALASLTAHYSDAT